VPGPCVIGVDLGGTKVLAGAVDAEGAVVARGRRTVRGLERDGVLAAVSEAIAEAAAGAGAAGAPARACIGIPGLLHRDSGEVRRCVHLPLEGLQVGPALEDLVGMSVIADNDANLAGLAEARAGAARGARLALMLTVGTGIGGAIVVDGEVQRGAAGFAGELGHTTVALDGPACTCGSRGCLEVLASGPALAVAALREVAAHPGSKLDGDDAVTGARVTELAHAGDPAAIAAAATVGRALGAGVASLVNAFDPDVVVIGGGVLGLGELLLEPTRIEARARTLAGERVNVVAAALGEEAGMLGAAMRAREGA
jgi:glucokinase